MRRIALLSTVLVLGGCAHLGPFAGKTVADKQRPNRLVATDGSTCVVSKERFDKVEVGRKVLCAWHGRSQPGVAPARVAPRR